MNKRLITPFLNTPFIGITVSTVVGILTADYCSFSINSIISTLIGALILMGICWWFLKKPLQKTYSFTAIASIFFFLFGITLVKIHHPKNFTNHYTHQLENIEIKNTKQHLRFYIKEQLKSTSYYHKYIVCIKQLNSNHAEGKLLLKIKKDSRPKKLTVGDVYTTNTIIKNTPKAINPDQFNYANYLEQQYVYHQITLNGTDIKGTQHTVKSVHRYADQIRTFINQKLNKHAISTKQLAFINALLLGQKQNLTKETINTYKDAGVIHILALSGLHIGIVLAILNFILQPLNRYTNGRVLKLVLIISIMISFAILAGLSPSIIRAVTMFSFMAIGLEFKSSSSIYNSLCISFFILCCFNPQLIYNIGFQLSYLAVFSIVFIQPHFSKLIKPKYFITKRLWQIVTVTLTAQIGIFPLLLYHFNQFPLLFLLTNILILPFLGMLIGFGVFIILLACLDSLPTLITHLYLFALDIMDMIVKSLSSYQLFVIKDIPCSAVLLGLLYLLILNVMLTLQKPTYKRGVSILIGTCLITAFLINERIDVNQKEELIIYHNHRNTTVGVLKNKVLSLHSRHKLSNSSVEYMVGKYRVKNHAIVKHDTILKNAYHFNERNIVILDHNFNEVIENKEVNILLLSNSPKINLNRIIDDLKPKQIIADASNYKSYMKRWKKSCTKKCIPFYDITTNGAFILSK